MGEDLETIIARFEREFFPPISPELIRAILSDYNDLNDPTEYESARAVLECIRNDAMADDAQQFDPSGTSGSITNNQPSDPCTEDTTLSAEIDSPSLGELSAPTSSTSNSGRDGSNSSETGLNAGVLGDCEMSDEMMGADEDTKVGRLSEMFHNLKERDLRYQLKKANGNFSRTTDALLNLVYLVGEQEGEEQPKFRGVDAFAEENGNVRSKKPKKKNRQTRSALEEMPRYDAFESGMPENRWKMGQDQIAYIAERTPYSTQAVSSIWHTYDQTVRSTLHEMIRADIKDNGDDLPDEEATLASTLSLKDEFPHLDDSTCAALVRLTSSSPILSAAHDLATALLKPPGPITADVPGAIIPKYVPLELPSPTKSPSTAQPLPLNSPSQMSPTTVHLSTLHRQVVDSAHRYHQLSRSNPHYGGVTAHYSSEARRLRDDLRDAQSSAADAQAALQSSATHLDLHGIDRTNGARIAVNRVEAWWETVKHAEPVTGHDRSKLPRTEFTIVVGKGNHSAGQRGVLGPAVARALIAGGWKIRAEDGTVVVTGRERNKARGA
ncbi:hypothetical protein P152DRAFT_147935 [Eremomyces bilateralis CBS 781.70]|uniref:Smr domain-containing protein n=1 Tax=Eremomyces bilateralis CBS 781.70 TaxID=1392243 RepID=A0A6G1FVP0_9PEZI|nr:uncharacterized protein P152DRAFT_147935 [Eremomyces bilateralis CBS 781.70]KAF1809752.1 hypothetical protein P152DRAFT_147935 [Eremomyces bilateralis CBS 781.70]